LQVVKQKKVITGKEKFWNVPNALSLYRLLIFPFLLYWVFAGYQQLVAIFIALNLFTDWLDGIIARAFNMQTKIGARLDSWADTGTYICAFLAIYFFKWEVIRPHAWLLYIFFGVWLLSYLVVFARFKGLIGLHTYLFKSTGYVQGAFIISLFLFGFYPWLFYVCMITGILACVEEVIIISIIKEPMMNVKGLYWVLKNKNR
jgi:CDP-diacylglycerol--glycerol-3-phosphate 3-phosphatidyltransferase